MCRNSVKIHRCKFHVYPTVAITKVQLTAMKKKNHLSNTNFTEQHLCLNM